MPTTIEETFSASSIESILNDNFFLSQLVISRLGLENYHIFLITNQLESDILIDFFASLANLTQVCYVICAIYRHNFFFSLFK